MIRKNGRLSNWELSVSISLTLAARSSGRRSIGYGKEVVYEEGSSAGSSVDEMCIRDSYSTLSQGYIDLRLQVIFI